MPNAEDGRPTILCELVRMSIDGRSLIVKCTLTSDDSGNDQNCLLKCKIPLQGQIPIRLTIEGDGIDVNSGLGPEWEYDGRLSQLQSFFLLKSNDINQSLRGREFKTRFFAEALLDIQSNHVIFQEPAANENIAGTTKVSIQL